MHEAGKLPSKLRWVPPSLSTRTNVDYLRGDAASDSEDEYYQTSCPLLPMPLPPVTPSSPSWGEERFEERNSYEPTESAPYISSQVSLLPLVGGGRRVLTMTRFVQWRSLPGPAIASPTSF